MSSVEADYAWVDLERDLAEIENQFLSFDRYSFFSIDFNIGFDFSTLQETYRTTYKNLRAHSTTTRTNGDTTFKIISHSLPHRKPIVIVERKEPKHLVEVFREGSNCHRFKINNLRHSDYLFEVKDSFLSGNPVIIVGEYSCLILDSERWRAYTELIIFKTILHQIPDYHLLHAGVVAWQNKGVIICGGMDSGKTTLTLGLVQQGCRFLSDEVAFIDLTNEQVKPFPRALGVRENTLGMFAQFHHSIHKKPTKSLSGDDKWLVDIEEIFPDSLGGPCQTSFIIFLEGFSEQAHISAIPKSEALLKCQRFSYTAEADAFQRLLKLTEIIRKAKCYRLCSGNLQESVKLIMKVVKE